MKAAGELRTVVRAHRAGIATEAGDLLQHAHHGYRIRHIPVTKPSTDKLTPHFIFFYFKEVGRLLFIPFVKLPQDN